MQAALFYENASAMMVQNLFSRNAEAVTRVTYLVAHTGFWLLIYDQGKKDFC